ncbi:DUF3332 domain-containing protein [Bacteroidales bacterium OttesenSCG-928-L03]|nr:DUF3332 domain-containing protein [Bacteroidales bacterium OttesenSCG-928-L03]
MKRKVRLAAVAVVLSSSIMFSSCIGSFALSNKLLSWNQDLSDKWVNELVFLVLWVVPAYEIAMLIDGVVLNTIEFWSGNNPASAQVQTIETEDGIYTVSTDANGHQIQKEGTDEMVEFRFDQEEDSWSIVSEENVIPLFKMIDQENALVYLADGTTMTISADQAGLYALKQVVKEKSFFAAK